jgi:hypothetical protein
MRCRRSNGVFFPFYRYAFMATTAALLLSTPFLLAAALAGAEPIAPAGLAPGDVAVSGFSGTTLAVESLPPGVEPIDKTVIDVEGSSLRIYDLSALGGAPAAQVLSPPVKFSARAKDIGQVFPLVFDSGTETGPPNLYAGATSAYGIQIVSTQLDEDGTPVRVRNGGPGVRFMDGQFGSLPGAGPGTIYKIDGRTGEVTVLADVSSQGVGNSGPGIGGLAIDPASRTLYASDLDTGFIYRFGLDQNAADLGQFDHGVNGRPTRGLSPVADDGKRMDITKPTFKPDSIATYGFTQPDRRVRALAVHAGRLYYAVEEGPEIWSIALNADGSFNAEDVRSELAVKADRPLPVTSIAFDGQGRMVLAQRGLLQSPYDYGAFVEAEPAEVLRYTKEDPDDPATPDIWAPERDSYAVGLGENHKSASGGAALQFAYRSDGSIDLNACYGTLAATADGLSSDGSGHGLQLNDAGLILPAADPLQRSAFVDYDSRQDKPELLGHVGAVAVFHACAGEGAPPIAGGPGYPPVGGGEFPPVGEGSAFPPVGGGEVPPVAGGAPPGLPPIESEPPVVGGPPPGPPGLELHKSAVSIDCNQNKNCTYKIEIENTTDQPINGPIAVEDTLEAGKAALNDAKISLGPDLPWTCRVAPPKFTCTHPGPIPAKTTIATTISFLFSPGPGPTGDAKEVKNCAVFTAPGTGGAAVQLPPTEAITGSQLKLDLQPETTTCSPTAGGCKWKAVIRNIGATPVKGGFSLEHKLHTGRGPESADKASKIELQDVPANMDCNSSENRVFCSSKAQITLGPNEAIEAPITLKIAVGPGVGADHVTDFVTASAGTGAVGLMAGMAAASIAFEPRLAGGSAPAIFAVQPPPRAGQGKNLKIEAQPGTQKCASGSNCSWNVTITNIGTTLITGSLEADGGLFVASNSLVDKPELLITVVGVSPFGLSCTGGKTWPDKSFLCTSPNFSLAPGQSFPFTLTLKFDMLEFFQAQFVQFFINAVVTGGGVKADAGPGADAPVTLEKPKTTGAGGAAGPQGGGQAGIGAESSLPGLAKPVCASIPVNEKPEQVKLEKKATVASCTTKGGCAFQVDLTNTGPADIREPLIVTEAVSVDGFFDSSIGLEMPPPAPWTCTAVALLFSCSHPGPLAAGASVSLPLSFKLDNSGINKPTKMKNCAAMQGATNRACAEIVVEPPPPPPQPPSPPAPPPTKANLAIKATDHGEPTCALTGPCTFVGFITNLAGTAPYNGKYILSVTFFSGEGPGRTAGRVKYSLTVGSAGWTCTPPGDEERTLIRCEHPQQLGPAGGPFGNAIPLFLALTPGTEWAKNNILQACFQLGNDPAGNDTFDPQKPKVDCATKRLDPFAVKIKKAGGESCAPGGECRFDLEIFNPGPIVHDDPVTVTDNLTGLASAPIVSIVPAAGAKPFPCAPAPTQIPFTCSGHMRLDINERHKYTMTVKLPANAPVSGAFKNCATVASPAGTKSDEDCHEVKLAPACTGGMELNADGRCACPAGQKWDGRACAVEKEVCPPSQPVGIPPNCCAQGFEYKDGACRCPLGTQLDKRGACIPLRKPPPKCPPNRPVGTPPNCCPKGMTYKDGACRCPEGMQLGRRGVCIAIPNVPERCPVERPVGTPPTCCPKGMQYKNGACRCPAGTELKNGVCIAIQKAPEICPPNRPIGTPPYCCPQNSRYENGACVCLPGTVGVPPFCAKQKEQQQTCPSGMIGSPPNCKCPEGTQWSRRERKCRASQTTPPSQPEPKMCVPYGQVCQSSGECCNNVPCNGGLCRYN